jgi:hypothetical protein
MRHNYTCTPPPCPDNCIGKKEFMTHPPTMLYKQLFETKIESLIKKFPVLGDPLEDRIISLETLLVLFRFI